MLQREIKGIIIYPPNQLMDIETPRPDGSLGPLYLAAALEKRGVATDILDATVGGPNHTLEQTFYRTEKQENGLIRIGMGFEEIAHYVAQGGYDFVGISSNFTPQTNMAIQTAKAIKGSNNSLPVFLGGVNGRALKDKFLASGYFDGICLSEGEVIFPMMVESHFQNRSLEGVPGVAYEMGGKIRTNPVKSSSLITSLDDLAMPTWDKLPTDKYAMIDSPHGVMANEKRRGNRYAPIMTSRGCPYHCAYCHISTEKSKDSTTGGIGVLRAHSLDRVLKEMDKLKSLGVERLFFEDDSLLPHKARTKEIFRLTKGNGFTIANVNGVNLIHLYNKNDTRPDGTWEIDFDYLNILKEAGFDQIVFPAESGNERIINKYASGKVIPGKMDLPYLMSAMTDRGIAAPVNMMIGFPDEEESEIHQSIEFAKRLRDAGAPYVTFFIPIPFPGSKLYTMAVNEGYLPTDFDPDHMNWKRPVMQNTSVHPERLIEIRDSANQQVNTDKHIAGRLKQSIGHRWQSNEINGNTLKISPSLFINA